MTRRRWLSVLRYFGLARPVERGDGNWYQLFPGRVIDVTWSPRSGVVVHRHPDFWCDWRWA